MFSVKGVFYIFPYVILFQSCGMSRAAEDVPTEIKFMPTPTLYDSFNDAASYTIGPQYLSIIGIQNPTNSVFSFKPSNVEFIAYKKDNPTKALVGETVVYDRMKKVAFYTHGFRTELLDDGQSMKDAIFDGTDNYDCVVLVDWRSGTFADGSIFAMLNDYKKAANVNVPMVGELLARFIDKHITNQYTYVHVMGHSLGGQISGIAGRTVKRNNPRREIDRISAMDPAGPIFEYSLKIFEINTEHTLRKTDAKFVDVIHASTMLGMINEAGHLDVYMDEIDCWGWDCSCVHSKAVEVFKASINKCSQMTCPYGKLSNNECKNDKEISSLGILANMYDGRGMYTAQFYTTGQHWWSSKTSTHECTALLHAKLKAKERICSPPTPVSKCIRKPYRASCEDEHVICEAANLGSNSNATVRWVTTQ